MPTPGADPHGRGGPAGSGGGDGGTPDARALARQLLTFVPDVMRLLRGILADERVPRRAKVEAGLMLAYLASPLDLVPDVLPVVGRLDDAAVLGFGLRRLVRSAGEDVVRDSWHGSDRGFRVLLQLVDVVGRPGGVLRRAALVQRLASAVQDRVGSDAAGGAAAGAAGPGASGTRAPGGRRDDDVVEGEVVDEVWHDGPGEGGPGHAAPGSPGR